MIRYVRVCATCKGSGIIRKKSLHDGKWYDAPCSCTYPEQKGAIRKTLLIRKEVTESGIG